MKQFVLNTAVYLDLHLTGSCLQYRAAVRASDYTGVGIGVLNLLRLFTCCHL